MSPGQASPDITNSGPAASTPPSKRARGPRVTQAGITDDLGSIASLTASLRRARDAGQERLDAMARRPSARPVPIGAIVASILPPGKCAGRERGTPRA